MNWSELNLSYDTQKLLEDLIDRKEKWDRLKKSQLFYLMAAAGLCLLFARTFYLNMMLGSGGNTIAMLDILLSNKSVLFTFIASVAAIIYVRNEVNKVEKAKKKYESLREEAIDKLDSSWLRNVKSETREHVSAYMKVKHDINIVYKS
ncbi:DUF2663 family protein [Paenibacillus sp. SI8]|uniref:DUF2663 family protein n=1 Tax=unclassified Paenibacillus TaxID=185978 RepID=UPI003465661B